MPIAGSIASWAIMTGTQQSQKCVTQLFWFPTQSGEYVTPAELAAHILNEVIPLAVVFQCEQFVWTELLTHTSNPPTGSGFVDVHQFINEPGLVVSDVMPPNVSYRFYKMVVNADREPPEAQEFRNGMTRLSGVPEDYQENGVLSIPGGFGPLNAFGDEIKLMNVISTAFTTVEMQLYIRRPNPAGGAALAVVPVGDVNPTAILGTQNTRKIGRGS